MTINYKGKDLYVLRTMQEEGYMKAIAVDNDGEFYGLVWDIGEIPSEENVEVMRFVVGIE